jgi:hypothetical protein
MVDTLSSSQLDDKNKETSQACILQTKDIRPAYRFYGFLHCCLFGVHSSPIFANAAKG